MYKFNNLLTPVATTKNAIPFTNCQALESFTILNKHSISHCLGVLGVFFLTAKSIILLALL